MKLRKNPEGVFIVTVAIALFASYATAQIPQLRARSPAPIVVQDDGRTAVVHVSAKRLSAAEKAALD